MLAGLDVQQAQTLVRERSCDAASWRLLNRHYRIEYRRSQQSERWSHDIENPDAFLHSVIRQFKLQRPAHLSEEQTSDLAQNLHEALVGMARRYDVTKSRRRQSFSTYAGRLARLRIADWYRKEFPGTRGGYRPVVESLDAEDRERIAQTTDFVAEVYETMNLAVLSPDAQDTFELIVRPMVERGLTLAEIASERGLTRRDVSKDIDSLRQEVKHKWLIAA